MPRALSELRPDERRGAAIAFLTLFGILAGHTLLETARDALFLARLPATQLPWVYLAMAGLAVALSQGPFRSPRRLRSTSVLSLLLLACSAVTFGFWALDAWQSPWTLRALYVWAGLAGTLTTLQFWLALGHLYTITQAKRVFRVVAMGSVMGAVAGASLARLLSQHMSAPHLVLAAAIAFAATALGPALLLPRPEPVRSASAGQAGLRSSLALLRNNPYVLRLGGLVLISTITLTLGDYVFKSTVARHVPPEELGSFFATIYMALNLAALGVQLFLLGWLLRVLGLHRAQWVLPALVLLGAGGVAFGGGLAAGLLLKAADGSLRHSLHRTSTELLFLPLPEALRMRAKPLIDVVGQRGGQALASVLILSEVALNRGDTVLAAAAVGLCVVWMAWVTDLKPLYLEMFRKALREGSMQRRVDAPDLDMGSLETLFSALNSQDDTEVVGALELLAEEGRARLVPALILYHPSSRVVLHALELFSEAQRTDFLPIADRLLAHPTPEVRAAALRARAAVQPDEGMLHRASQDPSPLVRAAALVGLVSGGWISDDLQPLLDALLKGDGPAGVPPDARAGQKALAQAIAGRPSPAFANVLLDLVAGGDGDTQAAAATAMATIRDPRFLPALLPLLSRQGTREAARAAFLGFDTDGLEFLSLSLSDGSLPRQIRRHIPRTLSRFRPEEATAALLPQLLEERDGSVRYKILRGLGQIASRHPDVPMDRGILKEATRLTAEATLRTIRWHLTLMEGARNDPRRATPGHELLTTLLSDKESHALERLFRLLGLQYRGEDFENLYRGLQHKDRRVRASSRELLEHLLRPPLREAVLALTDDAPDAQRLASATPFYTPLELEYETLLESLLDERDESLRCLAAYHVGELGLKDLKGRLEAFRHTESSFFGRVIERSLALLSGADAARFAHAD